jgi:putative copper resistance protein D
MITTPYGLALSAKIGLVFLLLTLAALHNWWFVSRLVTPAAAQRLKASIGAEIVIAAVILALAAALSTILGPAGLP